MKRGLLKIQRELAGLPREELAERAGVSAETIKNAEAGEFDRIPPNEIAAIGVAVGASMAAKAGKPKPPSAMQDILREFDRLLESERGKTFIRQQPDKEHASVSWDVTGDPQRNWLFVVVSNAARNARVAAVSDDPGCWPIGAQHFGMDAETGAIAEEPSNKLLQEHKAEQFG
jgi:DNA-binding XRE family transcriptional regulator